MNVGLFGLLLLNELGVFLHATNETIDPFVVFVEQLRSDIVVVARHPPFELRLLGLDRFLLLFAAFDQIGVVHR